MHSNNYDLKPTRKTFEDGGSAFAKKKGKGKLEVEKKKARLFEDELFQDEPKPAPKRELFSSPPSRCKGEKNIASVQWMDHPSVFYSA